MRLNRLAFVAGFVALVVGCYSLQPAHGVTPAEGTMVALGINDMGRVALGGSMGPEISQIEGRLLSSDSGLYRLAVTNVHLLGGGVQAWSGERVTINSQHVSSIYIRRFSPSRSVAMGAIGVGGFTAFLITRGLIGLGSSSRNPPDTSGGEALIRP